MQDGVIIVNTSRGAVIDEAELVKALDSGKGKSRRGVWVRALQR